MPFDLDAYRAALTTHAVGQPFQRFDSIDSTNAYVKRLVRQDPPPEAGLVVLADTQTAGYGQRGRTWESSPGESLTFTLLMPFLQTPLVTLAVGVALTEALRALTASPEIGLKWVNDLVLRGQKLGGVLVEVAHPHWMAIGVGVNLHSRPAVLGIGLDELGGAWPREQVLAELLNHLEPWLERLVAGEGEAVRSHWTAYSVTLGQRVRVEGGSRDLEGVAEAIDASGALLLRTPEGQVVAANAGTVRRLDGAYC